jgi:hypothetical protein
MPSAAIWPESGFEWSITWCAPNDLTNSYVSGREAIECWNGFWQQAVE